MHPPSWRRLARGRAPVRRKGPARAQGARKRRPQQIACNLSAISVLSERTLHWLRRRLWPCPPKLLRSPPDLLLSPRTLCQAIAYQTFFIIDAVTVLIMAIKAIKFFALQRDLMVLKGTLFQGAPPRG